MERLTNDHGWIGRLGGPGQALGGLRRRGRLALPAHRSLLRAQRGVLVQRRWAAGVIREEDPEIRVRAPSTWASPCRRRPTPAAGRAIRERFGLPRLDQPVLGSFGFQTPIKRTWRGGSAPSPGRVRGRSTSS